MLNEKNITKLIILFPIISIFMLSTVGSLYFISFRESNLERELSAIERDFFQNKQDEIKNQVDSVTSFINYKKTLTLSRLQDDIKNRTENAYSVIESIYQLNKNSLSNKEISKLALEAIRNIRFNDNRGYYFAFKSDGFLLLFVDRPELEGKNIINMRGAKGRFPIIDMTTRSLAGQEGYTTYYWTKPNSKNDDNLKISYFKYFKPLDIVIGTGEYIGDVENDVKLEILDRVSKIAIKSQNEYIYILDYYGNIIFHPHLSKGTNIQDLDINSPVYTDNSQKIIKAPTNTFFEYSYANTNNKNLVNKTAYISRIENWEWIVGSGFINDELKDKMAQKKRKYSDRLEKEITTYIVISLILSTIILLISYKFSTIINAIFNKYKQRVKIDEDELKKANNIANEYIEQIDKHIITCSTDIQGYITFASKALGKALDYEPSELIGKPLTFLKYAEEDIETHKKIWKELTIDGYFNDELVFVKKDFGVFWANTTISAVMDQNNNPTLYTIFCDDITDKKHIEKISITDSLTSLHNRRYFNTIFPREIKITRRDQKNISFAILDIDHFKLYNDTYGHQEGDNCLMKVANAIASTLHRGNDYSFRIGGEEFAVIFSDLDLRETTDFLNKIRKSVENLNIKHEKNPSNIVTISIGGFVIDCHNILSSDEIYVKADNNLYKAKNNGRNMVVTTFNE